MMVEFSFLERKYFSMEKKATMTLYKMCIIYQNGGHIYDALHIAALEPPHDEQMLPI